MYSCRGIIASSSESEHPPSYIKLAVGLHLFSNILSAICLEENMIKMKSNLFFAHEAHDPLFYDFFNLASATDYMVVVLWRYQVPGTILYHTVHTLFNVYENQ